MRPLVLVLTGDRVPDHLDLRRRRRRPGRRLRHRRPGADHLGGGRGHPGRPAGRAAPAAPSASRVITLVFVYTTVDNVVERPDGVKIGACFIAAIIVVVSLRLAAAPRPSSCGPPRCELDATAERFVRDCARRTIRLVANEPDDRRPRGVRRQARARSVADHDLPDDADVIFVEVTVTDPSDFETALEVHGEVLHGRYRVLTAASRRRCPTRWPRCCCTSATAPACTPHIYFEWTEGNPVANLAAVPAVRRRRGRAGHPRGAAPGRARPGAPAARARGLTAR